jgi:hypothetical protein
LQNAHDHATIFRLAFGALFVANLLRLYQEIDN